MVNCMIKQDIESKSAVMGVVLAEIQADVDEIRFGEIAMEVLMRRENQIVGVVAAVYQRVIEMEMQGKYDGKD